MPCSEQKTVRQIMSRNVNLGCLHPVARAISYDVGFNPSMQRHYRRLIYYVYYVYIYIIYTIYISNILTYDSDVA
jgi:hypothetical protein